MRRGITLLELIVTLVVIGIALGIGSVAMRRGREPALTPADSVLHAARGRAIREGRIVRVAIPSLAGEPKQYLFLPDGRAVGPGLDPLTGLLLTPGSGVQE